MTADTDASPTTPPWEPTRLHQEIRKWIEFFTCPPPPTKEEEEEAEKMVEEMRAMMRARYPQFAFDAAKAASPPPAPPPEPTVTLRRVLDALDRVALEELSRAVTDPLYVASALRLLDGATELRMQLGIERTPVCEIGPTTWQVAREVFDVVACATMEAPFPRWAREIARSLARSKARAASSAAGATPDLPPAPSSKPATDEVGRFLNILRGLELGALEDLVDPAASGDAGSSVLAGLEGATRLRVRTGIERDQEDALRRLAAERGPTATGGDGPATQD